MKKINIILFTILIFLQCKKTSADAVSTTNLPKILQTLQTEHGNISDMNDLQAYRAGIRYLQIKQCMNANSYFQ